MKITDIKLDTLSTNDFSELYTAVLAEDRKRKTLARENAIKEIKDYLSKIEYLINTHGLGFEATHNIYEGDEFYPDDFIVTDY